MQKNTVENTRLLYYLENILYPLFPSIRGASTTSEEKSKSHPNLVSRYKNKPHSIQLVIYYKVLQHKNVILKSY